MDIKGLTGAEAFLRLLAGMGVERIFASPGSEWSPVWEFLTKPVPAHEGIPRYLSARHEEIAAPRDVRPALERGLEATARGRLALIDIRLDPVN